jgi:hypothetical protein
VQRLGRLCRDYPGKESVTLYMVLPRIEGETVEPELVRSHVKTILYSMAVEAFFDFPLPRLSRSKKTDDQARAGATLHEQPELYAGALENVIDTYLLDPEAASRPELEVVRKACEDAGLTTEGETGKALVELVGEHLREKLGTLGETLAKHRRGLPSAKNLPDVAVGVEVSIVDGITSLVTTFGYDTMREFREAGGRRVITATEEETQAHMLAWQKTNGRPMTVEDYARSRRAMDPSRLTHPSNFMMAYGKTFAEVRDGLRGCGFGRSVATENEIRAAVCEWERINARRMRKSDYDVVRPSWGDHFRVSCAFQSLYGKTFFEIARDKPYHYRVPLDILKEKIRGLTRATYDAQRMLFGHGYPSAHAFRAIYGATFSEIADNRATYAPIDTLREKLRGLTGASYNTLRMSFGPGFPPESMFRRVYGKTFAEIRDSSP